MSERRLTVLRGRALAKLTLSLHVLGTRPDGFHDLDALTVAADAPHDDVTISPQARPGTHVVVTPRGAAPTKGTDNLAARAVELLRPHLPATIAGVRVRLVKRIPMGAGLGGGSADAATVLALLGRHHRVAHRALERIAAKLGSDVPFSLRGTPARLQGRGERLVPVVGLPALDLVVVTPAFGCATPAVYRAWDELGGPISDRLVTSDRIPAALLGDGLRNDLEPAAIAVAPGLVEVRDRLAVLSGRSPLLLGSGSSYAVIADDPDHAAALAARLRVELALATVWAATTRGS